MSDEALLDILASFHRARVLVLGDVMLDRFVYGSVERTSPEAPVPVMALERTSNIPGGAANVARNVAALGSRVVLIGVVGEDEPAAELRRQLAGVACLRMHLFTDASRPTTIKTRYVADRQQVLRADVELAAPLAEPLAARVLAEFSAALAEADIVILSDYGKGALSDSVTAQAIAAAAAAGKPVLVDPKSRSLLKYKGATVLTPNKLELQSACGHDCSTDAQVVAAARHILAQGICTRSWRRAARKACRSSRPRAAPCTSAPWPPRSTTSPGQATPRSPPWRWVWQAVPTSAAWRAWQTWPPASWSASTAPPPPPRMRSSRA